MFLLINLLCMLLPWLQLVFLSSQGSTWSNNTTFGNNRLAKQAHDLAKTGFQVAACADGCVRKCTSLFEAPL